MDNGTPAAHEVEDERTAKQRALPPVQTTKGGNMTALLLTALTIFVYLIGVANGGRVQAKAFDDYLEKRRLKQDYLLYLNQIKNL